MDKHEAIVQAFAAAHRSTKGWFYDTQNVLNSLNTLAGVCGFWNPSEGDGPETGIATVSYLAQQGIVNTKDAKEILDALAKKMESGGEFYFLDVIMALVQLPQFAGVSTLINIASTKDDSGRIRAIRYLYLFKQRPEVADFLRKMASDPNEQIRKAAEKALSVPSASSQGYLDAFEKVNHHRTTFALFD